MKIRNVKIIADLKGVDKKYIPLFEAAILDMQKVYENSAWDDAMKAVIAKSNKLEGELSSWKNKSVDQIIERFFTGKDGDTYLIHFDIDTYYTAKRVIGYGVASDDITRVNTKYLSAYTKDDPYDRMAVGSNLTHEKYHDRGMDHDSAATARRKNSIAYLSNDAFEIAYTAIFIKKTASTEPKVTTPVVTPPIETTPIDENGPVVETPTTPEPTKKKICYKPWYYLGLVTVCYYEK